MVVSRPNTGKRQSGPLRGAIARIEERKRTDKKKWFAAFRRRRDKAITRGGISQRTLNKICSHYVNEVGVSKESLRKDINSSWWMIREEEKVRKEDGELDGLLKARVSLKRLKREYLKEAAELVKSWSHLSKKCGVKLKIVVCEQPWKAWGAGVDFEKATNSVVVSLFAPSGQGKVKLKGDNGSERTEEVLGLKNAFYAIPHELGEINLQLLVFLDAINKHRYPEKAYEELYKHSQVQYPDFYDYLRKNEDVRIKDIYKNGELFNKLMETRKIVYENVHNEGDATAYGGKKMYTWLKNEKKLKSLAEEIQYVRGEKEHPLTVEQVSKILRHASKFNFMETRRKALAAAIYLDVGARMGWATVERRREKFRKRVLSSLFTKEYTKDGKLRESTLRWAGNVFDYFEKGDNAMYVVGELLYARW